MFFAGLCAFVFPGAVHTRFEHSVGVYAIAGEVMKQLAVYQVSQSSLQRVLNSCFKFFSI